MEKSFDIEVRGIKQYGIKIGLNFVSGVLVIQLQGII